MNTNRLLLISWLLASLPSAAFADLKACKSTHTSAVKACQDAKDGAQTTEAGAVSKGLSDAQGAGQSNLGAAGSTASTTTANGYAAAKGECEKQKKKCDDACVPAQGKTVSEKSQIQNEKKQCDDKIDSISSEMGGATEANKDAAEKDKDTKDKAAGGGASPATPQSDDKKSNDTPTTAATGSSAAAAVASTGSAPAALLNAIAPPAASSADAACASDQAYLAESCKEKLKAQCATDPSSSVCLGFTARFCGASTAASSDGTLSNGDTLKAGSGVTDDYCKANNAKAFCKGSNVDQCPSCRELQGYQPLDSKLVTQDCTTDPAGMYSTAATASTLSTLGSSSAASGGYGSSGGGGGSSMGASGVAAGATKAGAAATQDDPNGKLLKTMSTAAGGSGGGGGGEGGGGGSSSGPDSNAVSDFLSGYNVIGRTPSQAKAGEAPSVNPKITDVAPIEAPSVMRIQSLVIKARCDADKALNCPPHN